MSCAPALPAFEQVGNDLRQMLHSLQMWKARSSTMRYADIKDNKAISKDMLMRDRCVKAVLFPVQHNLEQERIYTND